MAPETGVDLSWSDAATLSGGHEHSFSHQWTINARFTLHTHTKTHLLSRVNQNWGRHIITIVPRWSPNWQTPSWVEAVRRVFERNCMARTAKQQAVVHTLHMITSNIKPNVHHSLHNTLNTILIHRPPSHPYLLLMCSTKPPLPL